MGVATALGIAGKIGGFLGGHWKLLGVGLIALALGVQTARVGSLKRDTANLQSQIAQQKAALSACQAATKTSETNRATEYQNAKTAVSDAQNACAVQVAAARKSAGAIKTIVEKPVAINPTTGCPQPGLISDGELRNAVEPAS